MSSLWLIYITYKYNLSQNRCEIWNSNDCNGSRIHNHLLRKRPLNDFPKLAKWLRSVVSTYLYSAFIDCAHALLEWIHTLQLSMSKKSMLKFIYLFIYSLFIVDSFTIEHIHIKKRLAVHKGKPLVTLIEVNTKCAYLEAH